MSERSRPEATRVRAVIQRLIETNRAVDGKGVEREVFPIALSPMQSAGLRDWVCRERAVHTLEVGLAFAFSALHVCEGLILNGNDDARHTTMDPHQAVGYADVGLRILKEAGVRSMVEHHNTASQSLLPRFVDEGRSFDLGFVDGNHRYDYVFVDLFYLGELVKPGGVVAVDDYNLPGIHRAVSFYLTNRKWTLLETVDDRLAVLRTASEPDERDFRYFVEF